MGEAYFSRLTLKRDSSAVAPLIEKLAPDDPGEAIDVSHRLLWTTMPEEVRAIHHRRGSGAEHKSAFLWRAAGSDATFYLLGPLPVADSPFFRIDSKPYAPAFERGDRLAFDLRANATVDRKIGVGPDGRARRARLDVALDRMLREESDGKTDRGARAARRLPAAEAAASDWLHAKGERSGFRVLSAKLDAYRVEHLPRRAAEKAKIGISDLRGTVEVTEPDLFVEKILSGFGRAKAFGCGLMLLRRAGRSG